MTSMIAQEKAAHPDRRNWGEPNIEDVIARFQKDTPVRVGELARELGIEVYTQRLSGGVSGMLLRDKERGGPSGYCIIVNAAEPKTRQRFTIAHEIGHYVLHRSSVGEGVKDDFFYRSRLSNRMEAEANRYAASLLMPMTSIYRLIDQGIADPRELARRFHVSLEAMSIRLGLPT